MAVTFNKEGFTISVTTPGYNPVERWLEMHEEMIDLLQSEAEDMHSNRYAYLELVRQMQPNLELAKLMFKKQ